jgi:uncharacterized membrane protein
MSGRLFWVTAAVLLGIAVHIAYVLFVPRTQMDGKMAEFTGIAGTNKLVVVEPEALEGVVPVADLALVYAVCVFDVSAGPVTVKAHVPVGYWLISFFAANGDGFYSLNNRQADLRRLNLRVVSKDSPPADETDASPQVGEGNEIAVRSPSQQGLVLLRARVRTPALRTRVKAELAASVCERST